MKKILSILLAAAMLVSFAVIGTANEDLHTQGEALLRETIAVFASENGFTVRGPNGFVFTSNSEDQGFVVETRNTGLWRVLYGPTTRETFHWIVFPGRRFGFNMSAWINEFSYNTVFLRSMPEAFSVTEVAVDGVNYIRVSMEGHWGNEIQYDFHDGQLRRIASGHPWEPDLLLVNTIEPTAQLDMFNARGILVLPGWILVIYSLGFWVLTLPVAGPLALLRLIFG